MYQILNEPPWYLLALSPQQFLCCDTLSWWVCSPPQLQIFCVWFLGLGECSHWCYRNMGSWCQYLTLWLQIGETPLLTAFSRRVSGSGKMRKKGGQKQSPAERMRGVRVCCCFMYQPINFLLWPLQVTLSFEASLTTPLVWIVSHHQSADLPPRMPYTNSWPASGLLWWGTVYSCAGGWKAISCNTEYFWHQGCIPTDLPNHSGLDCWTVGFSSCLCIKLSLVLMQCPFLSRSAHATAEWWNNFSPWRMFLSFGYPAVLF